MPQHAPPRNPASLRSEPYAKLHGGPVGSDRSSDPRAYRRNDLTMQRFVELSHQIVPGMKTYPGLPEPKVDVLLDYEASRERYQNQAEFYIASLHLCGNTGTYVDAPRHRYRDGADLAGIALDRLGHLTRGAIGDACARGAI